MPEIPDVEVYRRNLERRLAGQEVTEVLVHRPKRSPPVETLTAAVGGSKLDKIVREGKELVYWFDSGHALAVHLMLTGKFELKPDLDAMEDRRVSLRFSNGDLLTLSDRQGFATLTLDPKPETAPDALSDTFTESYFETQVARGANKNVKAFLVDQSVVRGIGNKYSDEILWAAGISPESTVGKLTEPARKALFTAIRSVLAEAVEAMDKLHPNAINGRMREGLKVHDLEKSPTGNPVIVAQIAGKKTYYCPAEQVVYQ
jgi:formamidopyrimidine-DNA glycosylase